MRSLRDWIFDRKKAGGETARLRSKTMGFLMMSIFFIFAVQSGLSFFEKANKEYQSFKPKTIVKVVEKVVKEVVVKEVKPPRWFTFYGRGLPTYEVAIGTSCAVIAVIILKFFR